MQWGVVMKKNKDLRHASAYGVSEVAHYLRIPAQTLRNWTSAPTRLGGPIIVTPPKFEDLQQLSFVNLVEVHVLGALRKHGVPLQQIKKGLEYFKKEFPSEYADHPLAFINFLTDGKYLLLDKLGSVINLSRLGQYEIEEVIDMYLHRIDYDESGPSVLYPFISDPSFRKDKPKTVMISPYISFGRPVLAGRGVSTEMIYDRFNAGELIVDLAKDYGQKPGEIEEVIRYESATRAAA